MQPALPLSSPCRDADFFEVQPLPKVVLRVVTTGLLLLAAAFSAIVVVTSLRNEGLRPGSWVVLVGEALGVAAYLHWMRSWRLETTLKDGVLTLRGWPGMRMGFVHRPFTRTVAMDDVKGLDLVPFHPVVDGWWGSRKGSAVRVRLRDGDDVRVGTGRPEELLAALEASRTASGQVPTS